MLTVAFAREGQAKGFAASGHDQVLIGVLATMLGLKVRVRAAVGTVSGSHGGRPAPADPASRAGASGRAAAPSAARPAGASDRPSGMADRPDGSADPPDGSADRPGAPGGMQGSAGTPPARSRASSGGPGGISGAGSGAAGRASSPPRPPGPRSDGRTSSPGAPAAADPEEEWPDDAGPAGGAGPPAWNSSSGDSAARSSRKSKSPSRGTPQGRRPVRRTAVTDGSPVCGHRANDHKRMWSACQRPQTRQAVVIPAITAAPPGTRLPPPDADGKP